MTKYVVPSSTTSRITKSDLRASALPEGSWVASMTGASDGVGGVGDGRVSRKGRPQPGQWIPEGSRPALKWISREQRLQRTVSSQVTLRQWDVSEGTYFR